MENLSFVLNSKELFLFFENQLKINFCCEKEFVLLINNELESFDDEK